MIITKAHWNKAYVPECVGALLQVVDIVALFLSSFIITTVLHYVPSREYWGLLLYSVLLMTRICESIAQHIT